MRHGAWSDLSALRLVSSIVDWHSNGIVGVRNFLELLMGLLEGETSSELGKEPYRRQKRKCNYWREAT